MRDIVASQKLLVDSFGVTGLVAVIGPSMGGFQSFQWAASYPGFMKGIAASVTAPRSPGGLEQLQALQKRLASDPNWNGGWYYDNGGIKKDPLTGKEVLFGADGKPLNPCGRFKIAQPGKLTPAEYDSAMVDLVSFLQYIAEPTQQQRKHIGVFVLMFLALLFVFAWLLNREYWKDVH